MKTLLVFLSIFLTACAGSDQRSNEKTSINHLADSYYDRFLTQFPEEAYWYGVETDTHDKLESKNRQDISKWQSYEDSLYRQFKTVDTTVLPSSQADLITYWTLKEALESSIDMRKCNLELWAGVDHMNGFHHTYSRLAGIQPVGTEDLRNQAFARWEQFPDKVQTEISNLKAGLSKGYSMPKVVAKLVIGQLEVLEKYPLEQSPFMSPALRDKDSLFVSKWKHLVREEINPAISQYKNFLLSAYLPAARDNVSILAIPDGAACYQAYIRKFTTLSLTPEEIFNRGNTLVSENARKALAAGQQLYPSDDLANLLDKITKDQANFFKTREQVLEAARRQMARSKEMSASWFAVLPAKEVTLKVAQDYEPQNGAYLSAIDTIPAYYRIGVQKPERQLKGEGEITAYHEAYPGHHLQIGIAQEIKGLHPISKITRNSAFAEGWARYSEQLAEEMGLYENTTSLILRLAWPTRGMVIDPGVHLNNWSTEQVTAFCKEAGYENRGPDAFARAIVMPAQLTAYDVGGEEFKALRRMAEEKLKESFDIREFHTKVLENGTIPLPLLRITIEKWIESKKPGSTSNQ
jgi:uncharacterized protein (DUF885 family)